MRDPESVSNLTDDDARQIAEQLLREVRQPPDPDNRGVFRASVWDQSPMDSDEDWIERALIDTGAVSPEQTVVGTSDEDEYGTPSSLTAIESA